MMNVSVLKVRLKSLPSDVQVKAHKGWTQKAMSFAAFLIVLLSTVPCQGQTDSIHHIEAVEITASRVFGNVEDLGRDIQVITQAQLKAISIHSVDEALKYLTGIDIQSRGLRGVQADVSLRGSTFNQTLILIDGIRANDPLTGHFSLYLPLIQSHIQRIEIIKGSSSGIHGADAIGGVINIVTKRLIDIDRKNPNIDARLTVGSFGLKEGELGVISQLSDKFTIGGGLLINDTEGELYSDSLHRDFSFLTYTAFANWQPTDKWRIGFRHAHDKRKFNAQYFYTRSTFDKSVEEVKRSWTQADASYYLNANNKIEFDALYSSTNDDFLFNPLFPGNVHTTRLINSNIRFKHRGDRYNWTIGINHQNQKIISNDRGNHQFDRVGVYFIGLIKATDDLSILTGLRMDHDSNIGLAISPHMSVSWKLNNQLSIRSFAGRAVRSADFTEKYISNNLPGPLSGGRNVGNPNLQEERSWNFDIGIDYKVSTGLKLSSSLFYRTSKDLIDFALTSGSEIHNPDLVDVNSEYFYAKNISSLNNYGIEFNIQMAKKISENFSVQGFWSSTIQDQSSDEAVISKYISSSANVLVNQSIVGAYQTWRLGWTSQYKKRTEDAATAISAQLQSSYWINNLSLSKSILNQQITIKGDINNIFNIDYSDILGANLPGRWSEISLIAKF